ncbi:MAG: hypothetical protein IJT94_09965 [Oscillibacter sp.]|nr:hypothetical protein [Oscillibacter sp.]
MRIRNEEKEYEGTGTEIMEQLRLETFNPNEFPDTASFIRWTRDNFVRATELKCPLPEGDSEEAVERQATTMIVRLASAGAFLVLDDGEPEEGEPEQDRDPEDGGFPAGEPEHDGEGDAP